MNFKKISFSRRLVIAAVLVGVAGVTGCAGNNVEEVSVKSEVIEKGADPVLILSPREVDGEEHKITKDVKITVPEKMTSFKAINDGKNIKISYFKSPTDFGMILIDTFPTNMNAGLLALTKWQPFTKDTKTTSSLIQLDWPGAEGYTWTWQQEGDAKNIESNQSGTLQITGISFILRTKSGQDIQIYAYAPRDKLKESPCLKVLESLTVSS